LGDLNVTKQNKTKNQQTFLRSLIVLILIETQFHE
jgi:hypothetical protein